MGGDNLTVEYPPPQVGNGGSTPTSPLQHTPTVRLLTHSQANLMLDRWHYLGPVRGILMAYGHNEGCLVFTNCRSRVYEAANPGTIELARMVGKPDHHWAMSSLMSVCFRFIRRQGYKRIITYADPNAGHSGKVYLAANFTNDGWHSPGGHPEFYIDGKRISPRSLYDRHGTSSVGVMRNLYGGRLQTRTMVPKQRFVLVLQRKES